MKILNILVGCEESQAVTIELRKLGHNAFSCDTEPCSGGHPEWHIQGDLITLIEIGGTFQTQDGLLHEYIEWDALIAFPPCTYMTKAGAYRMFPKAGIISPERFEKAMQAKAFFMSLLNCKIRHISLENPFPLKVVELPKETQTIQPYQYGHPFSKKTLLWLKNLPMLIPTEIISDYVPYMPSNTGGKKRGQSYRYVSMSRKDRSKTFKGIAKAMATQWSDYIQNLNS